MGKLVSNVGSIKDFFYLQEKFKDIPQLVDTELKFHFLSLNKGNHLEDVFNFIHQNNTRIDFKHKILEENNSEVLFYVKILKQVGNKQFVAETMLYLDKKRMNITLMTDDDREKLNLLEHFIDEMFPFASKKFIKSQEIIEIIRDFLDDGYFISASMVSLKRWWDNVQRTGVDYPTDVPITRVLEDLTNKKAFINSITLDFFDSKKENKILKIYFSRKGFIKFYEGNFKLFEGKILRKLLINNFNEKKLLENRTRKNKEINPLKVSFEKLTGFSPIEITKQFAKAISKEKDFSLAVYHNGNPYFHANVTDLHDGSLYKIIFHHTELNSELIISPQFATSSNSLSKFLSLVYSKFGEGVIEEYVTN